MRTEKIIFAVILLGLLLKVFNVPISSLVLVLSLSTISMVYFGGAFYFFCDKKLKNSNIALSIIAGIFLSTAQIGILYKLLFWPGGQIMLLIGLIATIVLLIIAIILKIKSSEHLKTYYKNMLIRTSVWTILTLVIYFIPISTLVNYQYKNEPEKARLLNLTISDPANLEYQKQYYEYQLRQDSIEYGATNNSTN